MKKLSHILFFSFCCFFAIAQPYDEAPKASKKVKQITEWVRPNLKAKSTKSMVSTFNKNGFLTSYTFDGDSTILNTYYQRDWKNRLVETNEGEGVDHLKTKYTYKPGLQVKASWFRGKSNRTVDFYNKKDQIIEKKSYAKGLELGSEYHLKERRLYKYNSIGQLIGEKIMLHSMLKTRRIDTRKKVYHYHPDRKYLIKTVEYDFDGSVSMVEDYAYKDLKGTYVVKSIISTFVKDKTISTKEYLYKKGKIWQKISSAQGIRHVEIFTDGRLIRLRSYNNDKVYRVVDYQYEYY